MTELILAYVPESEHLNYTEAQALALERDRRAADALRLSVPDSEKFLGPDELIARMARHGIRQNIVLEPPLNPRKTWGKI